MFKTKKILTTILVWRLLLFLAIIPAFFFLKLLSGQTISSASFSWFNFLSVWSNFDGIRFLAIAQEGYGTPHTFYSYSLFPLYPTLIRYFSFLGGYLVSGLIISHLCLVLSAVIFVKLAAFDLPKKQIKTALILISIFPSAFFLGSIYSESLFLLLTLLSFYFARQNKFLFAVIMAMLASYTRSLGILLWPALIIEYLQQSQFRYQSIFKPRFLFLLIPPLGFISYLHYLTVNTSHVFNFLPSLPTKLILLHQIFFRYIKMAIFINHASPLFFVVLTEIIIGTLFLLLLIFSYRKLRLSYWVYFLLAYIIPTFWGNFVGMPRFMLVVFPAFLFLSPLLERQHPFVRYFYYLVSILLLFINLSLFVRGYFVG